METMKQRLITIGFLVAEAILYYLIMTTKGQMLPVFCYAAIAVCFLFALLNIKRFDILILLGLAFTLAADFCLVICQPIQQLPGMLFFSVTQIFYAIRLHINSGRKLLIWIRLGLIAAGEILAAVVLKEKLDPLAVVSIFYYANLIGNIVTAFSDFSQNRLFAVGLVLFLLCDTVIGLQIACGTYLPIQEGSLLYRIIFPDFFLSWFFYLPSQVLISLSGICPSKSLFQHFRHSGDE